MKAAVVDHFGPPEVIHPATVPVPKLGRKELLIRVEAAAIGEWDPSLIEGSFQDTERKLPTVFGADGAGVVEAVGSSVTRFKPGDEVYGWGWANRKGGFFAEYSVVKERDAAKIPRGLSMAQAAALPISGITALQGLDAIELEPGDTLLLIGASGGVGHIALQLAKHSGIEVFAVASGSDGVQLAQRLGADAAVEGHRARIDEEAHGFEPDGFDGALVFAGGDGWRLLLQELNPGARVASPNGVEPRPDVPSGVRFKRYDGVGSPQAFERLNQLIEEGPFHVEVSRVYPLERVADALRDVQRHHLGKLELRLH
jgi:NADPH:quinone reductase-like Zn-dependent oxidoreductase